MRIRLLVAAAIAVIAATVWISSSWQRMGTEEAQSEINAAEHARGDG